MPTVCSSKVKAKKLQYRYFLQPEMPSDLAIYAGRGTGRRQLLPVSLDGEDDMTVGVGTWTPLGRTLHRIHSAVLLVALAVWILYHSKVTTWGKVQYVSVS